jgi:hypothetical protein
VKSQGLDVLCGVDCLVTCTTESYIEKPAFTERMLIQRQSYHGYYACTLGRVTMLGGYGTDSYTRVSVARHVWGLWPCPVKPDNKCHRFPRPRHLVKIYPILEAPGWSDYMTEPVPGRGGRLAGWTGGEILPAHIYCSEEKVMVWIIPGFSSFLVGDPSSSARSGGAISGMGCRVPQPFATGCYQSYPKFCVVTDGHGTRGTRPRQ